MVLDFPAYLCIMIGILLGVVLFVLSIPLNTMIAVTKVATKTSKSLLNRLGLNKVTEKAEPATNVVKQTGKVAVKALVSSLKFIVLILRLVAFICINLGLIFMLLWVFVALISVGSVGLLIYNFLNKDKAKNKITQVYIPNQQQSAPAPSQSGNSVTPLTPSDGTPAKSLETLAKAYLSNGVNTYLGGNPRKLYKLKGLEWLDAWDDCSGFAITLVSYIAGKNLPLCRSYNFADNTAGIGKYGWEYHKMSDINSISELQAGDIICYGGHVEIFISPSSSWGWGYVHKKYPSAVDYKEERDSGGKLTSIYNTYKLGGAVVKQSYTAFYRYKGKK